jgi:secondary thiamine-phosphate synthase enzyme
VGFSPTSRDRRAEPVMRFTGSTSIVRRVYHRSEGGPAARRCGKIKCSTIRSCRYPMSKSSAVNASEAAVRAASASGGLVVRGDTLTIQSHERIELTDITDRVLDVVRSAAVREGIVSLWSMHTTFSIFMNESQKALHADIKRLLETMVDRDADWMHNDPDHSDCDRLNADAHLRAMLLGHSLTLQVSAGELVLGQWQRVLGAELDGPRSRTLRLQVMGIA